MPDVKFPSGYSESEDLPKTRQDLLNCFNTGEAVMSRPGITNQSAIALGAARGHFTYNDKRYVVVTNGLLQVDEAGGQTSIGSVSGGNQVKVAKGFNHAVIVDPVAGGFTLDLNNVLTPITNSNYKNSRDVAHIDGRFVFIPTDGSPAFFSDVGDANSIQVESFFDAEQLPDKNSGVENFNNLLLIGGVDSFELFRNVGLSAGEFVPFRRIAGRIEYGYVSGLTKWQDTYIFIGRETEQDIGIYILGQGTATKVSNEAIDVILQTYTQADLELAIVNRLKWRGHDMVTFQLPSHSFAYVYGNWFRTDTYQQKTWPAGYITQFGQKYYTAAGNQLGRLDRSNKDNGFNFENRIDIPIREPDKEQFSIGMVEIDLSQGYNQEVIHVPVDNRTLSLITTAPDSLDISGQTLAPRGGWMHPEGIKAWMLATDENIYQYDLSTAFDISSGVYASKLGAASAGTAAEDMWMSPDGQMVFVSDISTQTVQRYTLNTPFEIDTISLDSGQSINVSAQETSPRAICLSEDGFKLYVAGSNRRVYQYTMTTAFDLTTATYDSVNLDATVQALFIQGVQVAGNKVWVLDSGSDDVFEYVLTSVDDVSTGTYSKTLTVTVDTDPTGLFLGGPYLYLAGNFTNSIYGYLFDGVDLTERRILGTVGLQMSRDNVVYGPTLFRDVAAEGDYAQKLAWVESGGLGYFTGGFAGMRITSTDDIYFGADKLVVKLG